MQRLGRGPPTPTIPADIARVPAWSVSPGWRAWSVGSGHPTGLRPHQRRIAGCCCHRYASDRAAAMEATLRERMCWLLWYISLRKLRVSLPRNVGICVVAALPPLAPAGPPPGAAPPELRLSVCRVRAGANGTSSRERHEYGNDRAAYPTRPPASWAGGARRTPKHSAKPARTARSDASRARPTLQPHGSTGLRTRLPWPLRRVHAASHPWRQRHK